MVTDAANIKLSPQKIKKIIGDVKKTAQAINLVYVNDSQPGIRRLKKGDDFFYQLDNKILRDEEILKRIKQLVIPPAWENVWICMLPNGHLQATGIDLRQRKQYKYHSLWSALRSQTKYYRLYEFGKTIPVIRQQLAKDLALPGLPEAKVLALIISLMEHTSIRIGNSAYEKLYGSFGLTTLKDQHVKISGDELQFIFKGKKGVAHKVRMKDKRLAKIVKNCRDIPGKELFQYYDAEGNHRVVDSGMVNGYIKAITGQDFTAKDFRTWAGSVHAIMAFHKRGSSETKAGIKNNVVAVLDEVAAFLGNTRSVCKKYYVHPAIIELYERDALQDYLQQWEVAVRHVGEGVFPEEALLMFILEKEGLCIMG